MKRKKYTLVEKTWHSFIFLIVIANSSGVIIIIFKYLILLFLLTIISLAYCLSPTMPWRTKDTLSPSPFYTNTFHLVLILETTEELEGSLPIIVVPDDVCAIMIMKGSFFPALFLKMGGKEKWT